MQALEAFLDARQDVASESGIAFEEQKRQIREELLYAQTDLLPLGRSRSSHESR
jgi:hypothetical protein